MWGARGCKVQQLRYIILPETVSVMAPWTHGRGTRGEWLTVGVALVHFMLRTRPGKAKVMTPLQVCLVG